MNKIRAMRNIGYGFTLIELLVSLAIGGLIVGLVSVNLNNFNHQQQVNSVLSRLEADIKLARSYATSMEIPQTTPAYSRPVEYVAVAIGDDGVLKIYPGNNAQGIDNSVTYFTEAFDRDDVGLTIVQADNLMFSVPQGKLVKFADISNTLSTPQAANYSFNIDVFSVTDRTLNNGVLVKASGVIEETANALNQVPTDAIQGRDPTIVIKPCSECGLYTTAAAACTGKCGGGCGGQCASAKLNCGNNPNCYSATFSGQCGVAPCTSGFYPTKSDACNAAGCLAPKTCTTTTSVCGPLTCYKKSLCL